MLISSANDYALRMCCYLAREGGCASSREIAEATGAPRSYLVQLSQMLRDEGIVKALPGKRGGYRLAKSPGEISALDIMRAVDESRRHADLGEESGYVKRQMLDLLGGITLLEAM